MGTGFTRFLKTGAAAAVGQSESPQEIADTAERAFALMRRHGVAPHPRNYTVWYDYSANVNPDLTIAVDRLLAGQDRLSEQDSAELYQRFYGFGEEAALRETSERIGEQMGAVAELLADAAGDMRSYGASLSDNLGALGKAKGLDDFTGVVTSLVSATRSMQARNAELESKLNHSSSEIESLKENLESVRQEAMTDALTGIANRKFLDMALRGAVSEAEAEDAPFCVALTDIDFFKKFNDTYGHQVGDQVLKLVAMILRQSVKGRDTAARYGGEEFAILLPNTRLNDARGLCEQIRRTVSSKRIRNRQTGEEMGSITLSIGVSQFRRGETVDALIQRADESLYVAKRNGRNQVVLETELENA